MSRIKSGRVLAGVCLLLLITACAASEGTPAESPVISPCAVAVEVDSNIFDEAGDYRTLEFACASSNGSTLRIFYRNESDHECTVTLFKYGLFGTKSDVGHQTIPAGSEKQFSYDRPGGKTFRIRVNSTDGGEVEGYLQASQF